MNPAKFQVKLGHAIGKYLRSSDAFIFRLDGKHQKIEVVDDESPRNFQLSSESKIIHIIQKTNQNCMYICFEMTLVTFFIGQTAPARFNFSDLEKAQILTQNVNLFQMHLSILYTLYTDPQGI